MALILRVFKLGTIPPSLYTDEANQGYNAYSILNTGKDEHGVFLPVALRSFGDWKPPLPTYLMIPLIRILGLKEISVRLPSVILGLATIYLIFLLVKELLWEEKYRIKIALLASFYLSISPWHILQSRAAMLVVIGLFFLCAGIYIFLKSLRNNKLFFLAATSFALSIYSYYGLRLVVPLIILFLLVRYRKELSDQFQTLMFAAFWGFLILLPLFSSFINQPDVIFGRAKTVSIFYDQGLNLRKWELITQDGINANPIITRFFHNNFYIYGRNIIQRLLSHFDGRYLFLIGDQSPPFQIPAMGILNFADLVLILIGVIIFIRKKYNSVGLIFFWLFVSFLPAAFTFMTPSSNRTFSAMAAFTILAAIGIYYLSRITEKRVLSSATVTFVYILGFIFFLRQYFIRLPFDHSDWWNYGWREAVDYVRKNGDKYKNVVVSDVSGMPYIYFLFYTKSDPSDFQKNAIRSYAADRFGFEHVEGYGKYLFFPEFDWNFTKKYNREKGVLYVVPQVQATEDTDYIHAIYYPDGKIAVKIFAYE